MFSACTKQHHGLRLAGTARDCCLQDSHSDRITAYNAHESTVRTNASASTAAVAATATSNLLAGKLLSTDLNDSCCWHAYRAAAARLPAVVLLRHGLTGNATL
jgi:hypothetical protein